MIEFDLGGVLVIPVIFALNRVRQVFGDIDRRIDHALAVEIDRHIEIGGAQRVVKRAGRDHLLGNLEPDLAPFVDDERADIFVGLVDVTVEQFEAQVFGARFFQEAPCLGP